MNSRQTGVDLSTIRYVKRISVGELSSQVTEAEREQQIELLNTCLSGAPPGRIIALEIATGDFTPGATEEHHVSLQTVTYHVGFERQPYWLDEETQSPT